MFRKFMLALFCVAMLVLLSVSEPVLAKQGAPTFETVFTPTLDDYMLIGGLRQFQSSLYISVSSGTYGGQIWRSFDGKSWEPVTSLGFGINPSYRMSWDMTVFNEKLYVAANCFFEENCPGTILRSANGQDWEPIPLETGNYNLDKLGVFKGMLYATSVSGGGQIFRSPTGDPGSWQVVKALEPGVGSSSSPTAYRGNLYISGSAYGDSVFIWRSRDGLNWDTTTLKITDNPVVPDIDYLRDGMLTVFKGNLYLCVSNTIDGGAIYRTKVGINWDRVVSGLPDVWAVMDMIAYKGNLYAASMYYDVSDDYLGTQLWRSHTGNPGDWKLFSSDDSLGLPIFYTERGALAVFKGDLYIENVYGSLYRMNTH